MGGFSCVRILLGAQTGSRAPFTSATLNSNCNREKLTVFDLLEGIKTHEVATPSPKADEILIQVAASSVNPCDVVRDLGNCVSCVMNM